MITCYMHSVPGIMINGHSLTEANFCILIFLYICGIRHLFQSWFHIIEDFMFERNIIMSKELHYLVEFSLFTLYIYYLVILVTMSLCST